MWVHKMKGFMKLLVKSGLSDLNHQDESKLSTRVRRGAASTSIKKVGMVSAFTLVNKVFENPSL